MKFDIAFHHLFMAPMDDTSGLVGGAGGGGADGAAPAAAAQVNAGLGGGSNAASAAADGAPGDGSNAASAAAQGGGGDEASTYVPPHPSMLKFQNNCNVKLSNRVEYVSLQELESQDYVSTKYKVFVGVIVRYKKAKVSGDGRTLVSRLNQEKKENQNFDRHITIMCLKSPRGLNTALITLNSIKADTVFGLHTKYRDGEHGFGPGSVVAICRPDQVSMFFGDKYPVPVLPFGSAMRLINLPASKFKIPYMPVNDTCMRMQSFFYDNVTLELTNINVGHTTCCGYLCDSIDMLSLDGNWRSGCPCYVTKKSMGYGILILSFVVKDKNSDHVIRSVNFTSRSFTNLLTKGGIPAGINPLMILRSGIDMTISEKLDDLIELINRLGGFRILGWVRMGRQRVNNDQDNAADKKETVTSSEIHHHITQILPNCNVKDFETKRVNIAEIYEESTRDNTSPDDIPPNSSNTTATAATQTTVQQQSGTSRHEDMETDTSQEAASITPPRPQKTPKTSYEKEEEDETKPTLSSLMHC